LSKAAKNRPLTDAERALAAGVFGAAIDYDAVRIVAGKWAFFQPRGTVMAPMGHIHFHPNGQLYCEDFCAEPIDRQGLFIHEMVHIWQAQRLGRWYLPLMRHPFCHYSYSLKPGWPLARYGIEQQAEIVRHYFLLSRGHEIAGAPGIAAYRAILPFIPEE
jgi:hypothetical protein